MKKAQQKQQHTASNVLLGMVAGGAVSAASMYYATHNRREVKRAVKKMENTAENAISNLDKVVSNIARNF